MQGVFLGFSSLWVLVFLISLIGNYSGSSFFGFLLMTLIIGIINVNYIKLHEITIDGSNIGLRNLFTFTRISKDDFLEVKKTGLSPLIYKMTFSNGVFRYFVIDNATLFEGLSSTDSNHILTKLKQKINQF